MALLTAQPSTILGIVVGYVPAAAADTFKPNAHATLRVKNGSGVLVNVTVVVPGNTDYQQPEPDIVVPVAAGTEKQIGPFPADLADPADGLVHITTSPTASVTLAYTSV